MKFFSTSFKQWATMPEKRQSGPLWYMAIFIAAALLALWAGRGQWGLSSLSFSYAHQVLLFSSGQGISTYLHWPPGYAVLALPLHLFGMAPLQALWLLSILAFALLNVLLFSLTARFSNRIFASLAVVMTVLHPVLLLWANQVMTEMVFTAALLWAFYRSVITVERTSLDWKSALWTGLALAAPYWFRFIGIMVTVTGLGFLAVWAWLHKKKIWFAIASFSALFCLPVLARNMLYMNTLSGHGLGNRPRADFANALSDTLSELEKAWLPLPQSLQAADWYRSIGFLLLLVLLLFLVWNRRNLWRLLLPAFPLLYMLGFAYAYSHARIDPLNERFVMPMVALLNVGLILSWHGWFSSGRKRFPKTSRILAVAPIMMVTFIGLKGGKAITRGALLSNNVLAAETLSYLIDHVPPAGKIAANRNQISAYSLDYTYVAIPSNRPEDADYQEVHRATWTRASALRTWLDRDIRYVAFFLGQDQWDPMLAASAYGSYVDSLRTIKLAEIEKRFEFKDGLLLQLVAADSLKKLLDQ